MKKLYLLLLVGLLFSCSTTTVRVVDKPEIKLIGSETWMIDGEKYKIDSTVVYVYDNNVGVFAIKIIVKEKPDESMKYVAEKAVAYAIRNGYFDKIRTVKYNGEYLQIAPIIGIALFQKKYIIYPFYFECYGYKFNVKLNEANGWKKVE